MDRCVLCEAERSGWEADGECCCADCGSLLLASPEAEADALADYYRRQAHLRAATEKLIAEVQIRYLGGVQ